MYFFLPNRLMLIQATTLVCCGSLAAAIGAEGLNPLTLPVPAIEPTAPSVLPSPDEDQPAIPPAPAREEPVSADVPPPPVPNVPPAPEPTAPAVEVSIPKLPELAAPEPLQGTSTGPVFDENWTVAITPMEKKSVPSLINDYEAVYQSIPFRRAEYLANPSYRHDATIEVLFGQMRPTVINRTDTPQRVVNPRPQLTQPYPISKGELYSYWPLLQYSYPIPLLSPIR